MVDATTSTATTRFDKTVQLLISKRLEELLRAPLPHLSAGNYIKATHVSGSNGTLRYLNFPDITVDDTEVSNSLVQVEGEPNDTDDLTIGYEEFSTRQRMKTLRFTDVALLQNPNDLFAIGANRLAYYVMKLADKIAANKIVTGTNVAYSGTGNTATNQVGAGDVLTSYDIKHSVALLEGDSIPRFGGDTYRGIMHPYVKFDVELDDDAGGWIDAQRYASPENFLSGELGKYAGVRFQSSSNAAVKAASGAGAIDVYSTTIFGPEFFAVGDFGNNETFVTPPGGHDDPGHQSALMTWKGWMDCVLLGEGTSAVNVTAARYIRIESASNI
jgi:N4-gp56 family major capsid protein